MSFVYVCVCFETPFFDKKKQKKYRSRSYIIHKVSGMAHAVQWTKQNNGFFDYYLGEETKHKQTQ